MFAILRDSLRETINGLEVTIQVARGSQAEFAVELGTFEQEMDNRFLYSYLRRNYPAQTINKIRLVQDGRLIGTTSLMNILAELQADLPVSDE
ncbi:MAG: hypothetical protein JWN30_2220 [Bacilli bacterium]|nr:hypothetical protein [Bacilli bacterium]